jgi:hypothetical protein
MSQTLYRAYIDSDSDAESASTSESGFSSDESALDLTQNAYITKKYLTNLPGTKNHVAGGLAPPGQGQTTPSDAGTTTTFKPVENTTLFMLNSRDRDTTAYPQPTFFTLRLPRVYKNVKSITLTQINLLNSFFNFSAAQQNTSMYVYEEGRVQTDGSSNIIKVQIRDGTYNATELVTELNNALNTTPLFKNISFTQFFSDFQLNGSFNPLFNTPGPVVYNALSRTYQTGLTISDVIAWYFQPSQSQGGINYSYNEGLVAYYYPTMKELYLDPTVTRPFNTGTLLPPSGFSTWYDYVVFGFQGINDPNILALLNIAGNTELLDTYHYQHTFASFLVNQYNCSYNSQQGRLVISAPSLNQSIVNDLNQEYSNALNRTLQNYPQFANIDDFQTQYSNIQNSNAVLIYFYNWLQNKFTLNFGINFGTYGAEFYGHANNSIQLYNTSNQFGWNLALTPAVSQSTINANPLPQQCPNLWPNLIVSQTANTPTISTFVTTLNPPSFVGGQLVFSNAGESQLGYTDISFSVLPMSYVRTTFTSPCRQSISLMTIPRYSNERGPGTNEVYNLNLSAYTPPLLFDTRLFPYNSTSYCLLDVSGASLFNLYIVQQNMFQEAQYMRAYDRWLDYIYVDTLGGTRVQPINPNYNEHPPPNTIKLTSYQPYIFFQMNADQYPLEPDAYFNVTFYVESADDTPFRYPLTISWYKDRAGFMADVYASVTTPIYDNDNPRNYIKSQIFANTNSAQMVVPVRNLQQTYFFVYFEGSANLPPSNLRVFCELTDTYGVYTKATQNDRLDMPTTTIVNTAFDPYTPQNPVFYPNLASIYSTSVTYIGYDDNDVSNNLTDYIIQTPNYNFYDPTNLENYVSGTQDGLRYQFNLSNVGTPQPAPNLTPPWSLYFGPNTTPGGNGNYIMDYYSTNIYYLSTGQKQTFPTNFTNEAIIGSMMDYTNPNTKEIYLSPGQDPYMTINSTTIFQPCINTSYSLTTDSSTSTAFQDIHGICGLGFFLPPNTILSLEQLVLKFAYMSPTATASADVINRTVSPFMLTPNPLQGTYNGSLYTTRRSLAADTDIYLSSPQQLCSGPSAPVGVSTLMEMSTSYASFLCGLSYFLPSTINALTSYIQNQNPGQIQLTVASPNLTYTFPVTSITSNQSQYIFANSNQQKQSNPIFNNPGVLQYTFAQTTTTIQGQWDDWYAYNRINTKLGIYPTSQLMSQSTSSLSLGSALYTMTLKNVSQAGNYTNSLGTFKTRQPDWGTFYQYVVASTATTLWTPTAMSYSSLFSTIVVPADIYPSFTTGDTTYIGYTDTDTHINNYTYLPRSYGIAPSVGCAVNTPYVGVSSYTSDIPNSYTAVPFYYNMTTNTWTVGSFYGLAFSREPAVPSTNLLGAAPYYGPPGIFGWTNTNNQFTLYNGDQPTYQPYYWNGKLGLTILQDIQYNPATDLAAFGGYAGLSGEFQDTQMFFYTNTTPGQDYRDISTTQNRWMWGLESNTNYTAYDDQSGYNFLSYLNNITVRSYIPEYAVHVRAYDPIPQFNTGLRIIGNNYTDFGSPTLAEIGQEISSLNGYQYISDVSGSEYLLSTPAYLAVISTNNGLRLGNGHRFSHAYADALTIFNSSMFVSTVFGTNANYAGVPFVFQGYQDALNQYMNYYSTTVGLYTTFTNIFSTTTTALNTYIEYTYPMILPSSIVNRTQYTAPLPFQLLFNYNLQPPYATQYDEWGLGWYLGFPKTAVPPQAIGPRTSVTATSFIHIVQDYIYLRLNPAYNINTMAVSGKEDLSETRESQGQDVQYFTKLILNDFAQFCRAAVQLQKNFSPVLGKYEIISIELVDKHGNRINNLDCEFDLVLEMTELSNAPEDRSSLVQPAGALGVYQQKIFGVPNK